MCINLDVHQLRIKLLKFYSDLDSDDINIFIEMTSWDEDEFINRSIRLLEKPYGTNNIVYMSDKIGISYVSFDPGKRTSLHLHRVRKEFFLVLDGELKLYTGDTVKIIKKYLTGESTPGSNHSLVNNSNKKLRVLELFTPCLLNDKERIEDFYSRTLGKVEYNQ